ncbi:helix-turn-helix domain-containing protein [Bradyrhizobium sp. 195]|uniref:hypothetical protein n=1 Tax=Bradyrhizobium sp. 195 TaxID=2782662 RepID=UPI0020014116|nr:hypothetical protein [Bradyrhizobium sp. 195]UPK31452.1 hypothetical protein IVB26_41455 [Bradyrhizobium sp. 195]
MKRRRWSADEEAKLLRMKASGKSWPEIAEELGRTQMSVEVRVAEIKRKEDRFRPPDGANERDEV